MDQTFVLHHLILLTQTHLYVDVHFRLAPTMKQTLCCFQQPESLQFATECLVNCLSLFCLKMFDRHH
jgi:hypothetical protein